MEDENRSSILTLLSQLQEITGVMITSNYDPDLIPVKYDISEEGTTTLLFEKNITHSFFNKVDVRRFENNLHSCNYTLKARLMGNDLENAAKIGNEIVKLYGADDIKNKLISNLEISEMSLGVWPGRSWVTNDELPIKVLMVVDEGAFEITFFLT